MNAAVDHIEIAALAGVIGAGWRRAMPDNPHLDLQPLAEFSLPPLDPQRLTRDRTRLGVLAGHIRFEVFEAVVETDLGEMDCRADAVNETSTLTIREIQAQGPFTTMLVELACGKLGVAPDAIDGLSARDAGGKPVPFNWMPEPSFQAGPRDTIRVQGFLQDAAPAGRLRFVLRVRDGVKELEVPFRATDVDLVNPQPLPSIH